MNTRALFAAALIVSVAASTVQAQEVYRKQEGQLVRVGAFGVQENDAEQDQWTISIGEAKQIRLEDGTVSWARPVECNAPGLNATHNEALASVGGQMMYGYSKTGVWKPVEDGKVYILLTGPSQVVKHRTAHKLTMVYKDDGVSLFLVDYGQHMSGELAKRLAIFDKAIRGHDVQGLNAHGAVAPKTHERIISVEYVANR